MENEKINKNLISLSLGFGSILSGLPPAAISALVLSISSRIYEIQEQAFIAIVLICSFTFSQIVLAIVSESHLAKKSNKKEIALPWSMIFLQSVTSIVVFFFSEHFLVILLALPILILASEVGRGISLSMRSDSKEIIASMILASGMLFSFILGLSGTSDAFFPTFLAMTISSIIRRIGSTYSVDKFDFYILRWVILETLISSLALPAVNVLIFYSLGAAETVLFAQVLTVSGFLALPFVYLRARLLNSHSKLDIFVTQVASLTAVLIIIASQMLGVFEFIFGELWGTNLVLVPLFFASVWRIIAIFGIAPYATLRRISDVKHLALIKLIVGLVIVILTLTSIHFSELSFVFLGLAFSEIIALMLYKKRLKRHIQDDQEQI